MFVKVPQPEKSVLYIIVPTISQYEDSRKFLFSLTQDHGTAEVKVLERSDHKNTEQRVLVKNLGKSPQTGYSTPSRHGFRSLRDVYYVDNGSINIQNDQCALQIFLLKILCGSVLYIYIHHFKLGQKKINSSIFGLILPE